jgi:hypothetical protein
MNREEWRTLLKEASCVSDYDDDDDDDNDDASVTYSALQQTVLP